MAGFHSKLASGLDEADLRELEGKLEPFTLNAGEQVNMHEDGRPGLYLIEKGRVEVHHTARHRERNPELKAVRGPGDYFGEYSLIDRRRKFVTITVLEDTSGRRLDLDSFKRFIREDPQLLLNLTRDVLLRQSEHDAELIRELTRTKTAAEKVIDRLKAITNTSQVINTTIELDKLLNIILVEAQRLTGAERGTIYLVDQDAGEIYSIVVEGGELQRISLPLGKGIAGHVALEGETVNITDAYDDPRFNPEVDKQTGFRTKSMLTMPMRNPDGDIVGVLQLLNKKRGRFKRDDEQIIETLGVHASIAIERAHSAAEMVRNKSLAAVGNLAATIIHDLKSPITVIKGYVELLNLALPIGEQRKHLEKISTQLNRMVGMTQELLDFTRGQIRVEPTPTSIRELLEELCQSLELELPPQGIEFALEFGDDDDWDVTLDKDRFNRVFYNLVNNAREAMPKGGSLTVRAVNDADEWTLTVADTGIGIAMERIERIFEPFSTYGKRKGTGLGLTIARNVIYEHGGDIDVESTPGEGTTFTIRMPHEPDGPTGAGRR